MSADPYDIAERYDVSYSGELVGPDYHARVDHSEELTLAEVKQRGGRISRCRILCDSAADGGRADFSYVHATLPDGRIVVVRGWEQHGHGMTRWNYRAKLIDWAKREGVYAKGIGLLDNVARLG